MPQSSATTSAETSPPTPHGAARGLLRLITCGSVDDGKSTLIGRMLFDSKGIFEDQLHAIERTSRARGDTSPDLALLTDGLRAEREQGITIDVAYRSFSTPARRFILADTPGHVQYTRNMATGASTADAAILLVDARKGILEQTRRHAFLATLLGIRHLVLAVNKMDLVDFSEPVFTRIAGDFHASVLAPITAALGTPAPATHCIPISALRGDNVVTHSTSAPYYTGPALLEHLESIPDREALELAAARFPVQYVIRPRNHPGQSAALHDYRGYAGQIAAGRFSVGDEIVVLPSARRSRITRIHLGNQDLQTAVAPQSIALILEHDLDIARGDLLVRAADQDEPARAAVISQDLTATIIWMADQPLVPGRRLLIKHTSRTIAAVVRQITDRLDIATLAAHAPVNKLELNEIGGVTIQLAAPLAFDSYTRCRLTGAFILIDEQTNNTVGAGLLG